MNLSRKNYTAVMMRRKKYAMNGVISSAESKFIPIEVKPMQIYMPFP